MTANVAKKSPSASTSGSREYTRCWPETASKTAAGTATRAPQPCMPIAYVAATVPIPASADTSAPASAVFPRMSIDNPSSTAWPGLAMSGG